MISIYQYIFLSIYPKLLGGPLRLPMTPRWFPGWTRISTTETLYNTPLALHNTTQHYTVQHTTCTTRHNTALHSTVLHNTSLHIGDNYKW